MEALAGEPLKLRPRALRAAWCRVQLFSQKRRNRLEDCERKIRFPEECRRLAAPRSDRTGVTSYSARVCTCPRGGAKGEFCIDNLLVRIHDDLVHRPRAMRAALLQRSGFKVWGSGFRVKGSGLRG